MIKSIGALAISWLLSVIAWMILMMALMAISAALDPVHFQLPPGDEVPNPPNNTFWVLSLVIDGVMAVLAGVLVTRFSPSQPKVHLTVLMALFCAGTIATAFGEAGMLPEWVSWSRVVIVVVAMYGAGMWRISRRRDHSSLESMVSLQS
ncbi:MAG: hypothetical protein P1V97_00630 [Planctomycetota bacterium]|nr:hypothetical protein [Planctomycetota bacterium]